MVNSAVGRLTLDQVAEVRDLEWLERTKNRPEILVLVP